MSTALYLGLLLTAALHVCMHQRMFMVNIAWLHSEALRCFGFVFCCCYYTVALLAALHYLYVVYKFLL